VCSTALHVSTIARTIPAALRATPTVRTTTALRAIATATLRAATLALRTAALTLTATRTTATVVPVGVTAAEAAVWICIGVSGTAASAMGAASSAAAAAATATIARWIARRIAAALTTTAFAAFARKPGARGWQFLTRRNATFFIVPVRSLRTIRPVDVAVHFAIRASTTSALLLAARRLFANAIECAQFARFLVITAAPR